MVVRTGKSNENFFVIMIVIVTICSIASSFLNAKGCKVDVNSIESYSDANSNVGKFNKTQSKRLELVHIPKTSGTSMEVAFATQLNGKWGACHFLNQEQSIRGSKGSLKCPDKSLRTTKQFYETSIAPKLTFGCQPWHAPPYLFDPLPAHLNPYAGSDLFAVVRDPFERIISEYYYIYTIENKPTPGVLTKTHLNIWIRQILLPRKSMEQILYPWNIKDYCKTGGHWVPQYRFIYDAHGNQVVKHILRMENLHEDFAELVKQYPDYASLTLPHAMIPKKPKTLTVQDLTPQSKSLIVEIYTKDFEMFNYSKTIP